MQLHQTRKRAGLAELKGLSKADAQLAIEPERRLELCFEGHRWHDLIRWGKEVATMQAFKTKWDAVDVLNANISITPDCKLRPIPCRETSLIRTWNKIWGSDPVYRARCAASAINR